MKRWRFKMPRTRERSKSTARLIKKQIEEISISLRAFAAFNLAQVWSQQWLKTRIGFRIIGWNSFTDGIRFDFKVIETYVYDKSIVVATILSFADRQIFQKRFRTMTDKSGFTKIFSSNSTSLVGSWRVYRLSVEKSCTITLIKHRLLTHVTVLPSSTRG